MTRWSLATRITLLVVAVAVVVAGLGAVLTLQLVRTTVEDQAREQLSTQADMLRESAGLPVAEATARRWVRASGDLYAVVTPDGTVRGTAARYVGDDLVAALLAGEQVSDTTRAWRHPVILEGRPAGAGAIVLARPNTTIAEARRSLIRRIVPALAVGAVVAVLGGAWLARRITRPLTQTAHAAGRLAAGERGVPLPRPEIPEVRTVADALAGLDRALSGSESRQREFLLSISHELRTPLTALRGYAEALADGVVTGADVPAVGSTLRAETDRLGRFVDDLLELARLEADDFALAPAPVDLREIVVATETAWRPAAQRLGVVLVTRQPAAAVTVTTDARRVRQIVDGLVENALRVSPDGAELALALSADGADAVVAVRDHGPGLTDDDLAHAFDRGVLRDRYRGSRPVGTGLGLSIAVRLTARLGGRIGADRAPGGGTVFTVRIPLHL